MARRTALVVAALCCSVRGDVIYQTADPYFGPNGPPGFDLSHLQSVGVRFTPARDFTLDSAHLWIMSNDFSHVSNARVRVELRTSAPGDFFPTATIIDESFFLVSALGWNPVLESVTFRTHPLLRAGTPYWIVLECDMPTENNPSWNWSSTSTGFLALTYEPGMFIHGGEGAVAALRIEGTPACYANCDGSSGTPALNINDFMCFVNSFAAGNAAANCDQSTAPPVLNALDFQCFLNAFAAGCP